MSQEEVKKWPNATNYGLVVGYMDRAQGATQGVLPQNLRGTHISCAAESSGRQYVAAALLGNGHAAWQLATSAEVVDRGLAMRSSGWYCSPGVGEQISPLERIANPRSTASALVARCHVAWPSPRSAAATYRLPLDSAELVWVPRRF